MIRSGVSILDKMNVVQRKVLITMHLGIQMDTFRKKFIIKLVHLFCGKFDGSILSPKYSFNSEEIAQIFSNLIFWNILKCTFSLFKTDTFQGPNVASADSK